MNDPFEPQQETPSEEIAQDESPVDPEDGVSDLAAVEGITLDEAASPVPAEEYPVAETADQAGEDGVVEAETVPEEIVPAETAAAATGARLAWWPFLLLVGSWVALAGAAAYVLTRNTELPAFEHEYYPAIVLAGVVLTLLGPVLAVLTWAVSPKEGERGGPFVTSIMRASVVTLFGVLMWWGVLVAVDALRLGLIKL